MTEVLDYGYLDNGVYNTNPVICSVIDRERIGEYFKELLGGNYV